MAAAVEDRLLRFPARCDAWRCPWCGHVKARRYVDIVAWAEPTRFLTLTQAPDTWQPLRQKVRKLAHRLRQEGYRVEWAWTVEKGNKTGMIHVHAIQHGDYIPQAKLQGWWGHIVHISRIDDVDQAAEYTMKHAARRAITYTMKQAGADLDRHLDLNGGRGVHLSRGYLRGKRSRDVWQLLHPPSELKWVQVPAHLSNADVEALLSTVG